MREDYEKWRNEFSKEERLEMMMEEGVSFFRDERITMAGVVYQEEGVHLSIPGSLIMKHPSSSGRIIGNCSSRLSEEKSYIEGRLTDKKFDFIEFYLDPHSLGISREYHLKKEGDIWIGEFTCSKKDEDFSKGHIKLSKLRSEGVFPSDTLEDVSLDGICIDDSKIGEFWSNLSPEEGFINPYKISFKENGIPF